MTVYTIELQRPAGTLERRSLHRGHVACCRALAIAIKRSRPDGLVVVLRNGKEISYAELRGLECRP